MNYIADTIHYPPVVNRKVAGRFTLNLDGTTSWVSILNFDPSTGTGIACSKRTGQLFAFEVTGRVPRGEMLRAAAYPMADLSLADGTMAADRGHRLGARVARRLAAASK
jgi:hypothetical protein